MPQSKPPADPRTVLSHSMEGGVMSAFKNISLVAALIGALAMPVTAGAAGGGHGGGGQGGGGGHGGGGHGGGGQGGGGQGGGGWGGGGHGHGGWGGGGHHGGWGGGGHHGGWGGGGHHGGGRWWRGRWWDYGVGSCWRWHPYRQAWIWVCG